MTAGSFPWVRLTWLVMLLPLTLSAQSASQNRPNILFCIADDWGWPHAGAYGDAVVKTPAFDRIAREGALFTHCYAASPSCTPSRNAILTGQYHWRLGPGANLWSSLDRKIQVYPLLLEANGYEIGHWRKSWGPGKLEPGGYTEKHPAGPRYPKGLAQFLKARADNAAESPIDAAAKPFCFWLGSYDPHRDYQAGSGKSSGMDLDQIQVPGFWPNVEQIRSDIADYYLEVQRFDKDVQNALELLEQSGELENTIVVVTGDHGMPFPRCKSNCYDMGVRVPLAIRWGKRIDGAQQVNALTSLVDLMPTFLAAAKVAPTPDINGHSWWPLLNGNDLPTDANAGKIQPAREHAIFGKERHVPCRPDHSGYPSRGIRTARWAYIRNFEPSRWPVGNPPLYGDTDPARAIGKGTTKGYLLTHSEEDGVRAFYQLCFGLRPTEELYDMAADPDQLINLAGLAQHQEIKDKLWLRLRTELTATQDPRVIGGAEQFDRYPYYGGSAWRPAPPRKNTRKKDSKGKEAATKNAIK